MRKSTMKLILPTQTTDDSNTAYSNALDAAQVIASSAEIEGYNQAVRDILDLLVYKAHNKRSLGQFSIAQSLDIISLHVSDLLKHLQDDRAAYAFLGSCKPCKEVALYDMLREPKKAA